MANVAIAVLLAPTCEPKTLAAQLNCESMPTATRHRARAPGGSALDRSGGRGQAALVQARRLADRHAGHQDLRLEPWNSPFRLPFTYSRNERRPGSTSERGIGGEVSSAQFVVVGRETRSTRPPAHGSTPPGRCSNRVRRRSIRVAVASQRNLRITICGVRPRCDRLLSTLLAKSSVDGGADLTSCSPLRN